MRMGIVGLAQSGKKTLFQLLVGAGGLPPHPDPRQIHRGVADVQVTVNFVTYFSPADVTFGAAANSDGTRAMAIHVSIDFLAPPGDTEYLEADVREDARAGRGGHYVMKITNDSGESIAVCNGWAYHTARSLRE